jgi:hypothetical protein
MIDLSPSPWISSRQGRGSELFDSPLSLFVLVRELAKIPINHGIALKRFKEIQGEGDQKRF